MVKAGGVVVGWWGEEDGNALKSVSIPRNKGPSVQGRDRTSECNSDGEVLMFTRKI